MTVIVRDAVDDDERAWANDWYRRVLFAPTAPTDMQLIAELAERDGMRIGLGRLVDLGDDGRELGGIYTDGAVRGRGVASAVVTTLCARARGLPHATWCVPFAALTPWYLTFGMVVAAPPWPARVTAKVEDCRARGLWPVDVLRLVDVVGVE